MLERTRLNSLISPDWTLKFNRLTARYTLVDLFDDESILKKKFVIDIFIVFLAFMSIFIAFEEVLAM